jgi:phosphate transport system substrate-binding protein
MKKLAMLATFMLWTGGAGLLEAQEKIVVGGSGAMGEAIEVLAKAYNQKQPSDNVEVIPEAMSTTGGIEGTKAGRLTVGIITRAVNDSEKKQGLVYRPATRIPVVVGVHKSLPVVGLSDSQVCEIFGGKVKSWKEVGGSDGRIMVLARKKDDNSMEVFRQRMGCFKSLQISHDAVLLGRGSEVLDSLNNRPGTIGVTIAGASLMERPNIKSLTLSGVTPTLDAVEGGKYKYYNEIGFVTKGEPAGLAKRFVDFVGSAEGEKILDKYGMAVGR